MSIDGRVNVHVRTALRFDISGTAGRIALQIGVWLEDNQLYTIHMMGGAFSSAHVTVHTFKHSYRLPLVQRPEGALLVDTYKQLAEFGLRTASLLAQRARSESPVYQPSTTGQFRKTKSQ